MVREVEEDLRLGDHQPYWLKPVGDGHPFGAEMPQGQTLVDFFANNSSVLPMPERDAEGRVIKKDN